MTVFRILSSYKKKRRVDLETPYCKALKMNAFAPRGGTVGDVAAGGSVMFKKAKKMKLEEGLLGRRKRKVERVLSPEEGRLLL